MPESKAQQNDGGCDAQRSYKRSGMFNDYIAAIESGLISYPMIKTAYEDHKYVTNDDLFGGGHPPDSFIAAALAWNRRPAMSKKSYSAAPIIMPRSEGASWIGQPR